MRYEFALSPNHGFLACPTPLLPDCELKISFDRTKAQNVLIAQGEIAEPPEDGYIEIKDCMAITEWISSPKLRSYFETIDNNPIIYDYDDCEVLIKNIPNTNTHVRLDNIRGGNVPDYLFAAVVPQQCLSGDYDRSSTLFYNHNVSELNFTLNGNSVNGYPLEAKNSSPVYAMQKFFDVTGRMYNIHSGESLSCTKFGYNFIWSHKFEAEATNQGWLGVEMKLSEGYAEDNPMCLVLWIITSNVLKIDKFHQIEKINL